MKPISGSALGWVEISPSYLMRLRKELQNDQEGVRDEMGVGYLHAAYSDRFFPGTSVLHQRPRYAFFTAWNYLSLDDERLGQGPPLIRKEAAERWVRDQLVKHDKRKVIGANVPKPAQPVDFIYWTALRTWGFYQGPSRAAILQRWSALRPRQVRPANTTESEAPAQEPAASFYVPDMPRYWLSRRMSEPLTLDLTRDEAEFLKERLESIDRPCMLSFAATLSRAHAPTKSTVWSDPLIIQAANEIGEGAALRRARLASSFAKAVRAIYGALVERQQQRAKRSVAAPATGLHYLTQLAEIMDPGSKVLRDVCNLNLEEVDADIRMPQALHRLLNHVQARSCRIRAARDIERFLLADATLREFCDCEKGRKGDRARLPDTEAGEARRVGFDSDTVAVTGISYRWDSVSTLLSDLHSGLMAQQ